ncbi:hypothetical protein IFM89_038354 [Coptis chinensis]|uniref:Cathepsin propeptide inhibitor domain-containing protein n=1 Tax=Coptis chinensis TaxID=261450 RepID=A0A835I6J0_9MAGN|nr:hypothetical protein IFM89_038354 [Coptis chinensis]
MANYSSRQSKCLHAILFVLVICAYQGMSLRTLRDQHEGFPLSMDDRHEQWMTVYGRTYKDSAEKQMRFQIFKTNIEFIDTFNKKDRGYIQYENVTAVPSTMDWRTKGALTVIKDQGQCV